MRLQLARVKCLTAGLNQFVLAVAGTWCHHFMEMETETEIVCVVSLRPHS